MTTTLLAPSMRLANEAIAKRIVAKVRDHSPGFYRGAAQLSYLRGSPSYEDQTARSCSR
jgi:hypothetical protein